MSDTTTAKQTALLLRIVMEEAVNLNPDISVLINDGTLVVNDGVTREVVEIP